MDASLGRLQQPCQWLDTTVAQVEYINQEAPKQFSYTGTGLLTRACTYA